MRCIFHWATPTVWRLWISQRVTLDWRILSRVWCLFWPTFRLTVVPVCGCFLEFYQLSEMPRISPGNGNLNLNGEISLWEEIWQLQMARKFGVAMYNARNFSFATSALPRSGKNEKLLRSGKRRNFLKSQGNSLILSKLVKSQRIC